MATDTYGDNPRQEGDVLLCQTPDEGEIFVEGGITEMTVDFRTMAYLSLFGGNVDDPGGDDKTKQWWGNYTETEPAKKYRSELQHILQSLPATSGNLIKAEQAATNDLTRDFLDTKIANSVVVAASIPALNRLKLQLDVDANGQRTSFTFVEVWEASV